MANFLTRLAARATGIANVAQPVVHSVFSPELGQERGGPPAEISAERAANPGESTISLLGTREAGPVQPEQGLTNASPRSGADELERPFHPLYKERGVHDESLPLGEPQAPMRERAAALPAAHPLSHAQPAEDKRFVLDLTSRSLPPENGSTSSELIQAPMPAVVLTQPGRREEASPAAATLPGRHRALPTRRDQMVSSSVEAPVVRVTIGRIDVRAQFSSPAPTSSATRHQRPPALSLEEYSKQRREGKR